MRQIQPGPAGIRGEAGALPPVQPSPWNAAACLSSEDGVGWGSRVWSSTDQFPSPAGNLGSITTESPPRLEVVMEEEPTLNAAYCVLKFRSAPPSARFPTNLDFFVFLNKGPERLRGFPKVTQPIKGRTGFPNTDSTRGSTLFRHCPAPFR